MGKPSGTGKPCGEAQGEVVKDVEVLQDKMKEGYAVIIRNSIKR